MMIWGNLVTLALPSYQWQCFCARSVPGMRKVAIHPAALVWNHDAPGILLLWKLWTTICDMTGLPTWHNSLVWLQQNLKTTNIFKMQKIFRFKFGQESFKSIFTRPLPSSSMFAWQGFQFDQATCHFWICLLILTDLACTSEFCLKQTDDHHHPDSWLWRRRSSW